MSERTKLNPQKAICRRGTLDSWWYENAKSIDVYVQPSDTRKVISCRIRRAQLADWLKRTERNP